jgi:hypothetical protein
VLTELVKRAGRVVRLGSGSHVRIRSVEWKGDLRGASIRLELNGNGAKELWSVEAEEVLDSVVHPGPTKHLELTRRHILIDSQVGPFGDLRFRGSTSDSSVLLDAIWERHRLVAGDWIEVDECFAARESLPRMLGAGRGFASGPISLLTGYASILKMHHFSTLLTRHHESKPFWFRGRWHANRPAVWACIIGPSYFLATRFRGQLVE